MTRAVDLAETKHIKGQLINSFLVGGIIEDDEERKSYIKTDFRMILLDLGPRATPNWIERLVPLKHRRSRATAEWKHEMDELVSAAMALSADQMWKISVALAEKEVPEFATKRLRILGIKSVSVIKGRAGRLE